MNKTNKLLSGWLVAVILGSVVGFAGAALVPAVKAYLAPTDAKGNVDLFGAWTPLSKYGQGGVGSTCNLIDTGAGVMKGADVAGAPHDWIVWYDSASISGLSGVSPSSIDTSKLVAAAYVDTTKLKADVDEKPRPYTNGLVACPKAATVFSVTRYFPHD